MTSPSPQSIKRDFGLQHGRMTLPPSSPASPGANYIGATSNTLPLDSSTPMQRDTLQYKITWTDKVKNVFRFKKKKKGGFTTDPDIEKYPQPFSRASGPVVHSTPKLFDPTKSLDNLVDIGQHCSDDDMPTSLDDDITPGKLLTAEADDSSQMENTKLTKEANKKVKKQSSHTETSNELAADFSHDDSTGQNTSNRTQSPSELSESSVRESSSRQFSSDITSSEDEQDDGTGGAQRKISAMTSIEWQQQIIAQNTKKKKRSRSIDNKTQFKIIERPLSVGNSSNEAMSRSGTPENKLAKNSSDGVTSDGDSASRRSKKKKQGRVKGPHKSRENLGRPTILDTDLQLQPDDQQQTEESRDESEREQKLQQEATNKKEDAVDFMTIPGGATKLSLQAAHDKRNAARNIKRRRATTKRSLFLHQNEQAKYGTDLVDPSKIGDSLKSQKVRKAEQIVQHLRRTQSPPSRPTSASMVAKAAEHKKLSGENTPAELVDPALELARTDSKKRFSMSLLINKQILDSPVNPLPAISPKPRPQETNPFENVRLKPIQNSPVKAELNAVTSTENISTKPSGPPTRSKPRRSIPDDKTVSPVKENGIKDRGIKLAPVKFDKNDKLADKKVTNETQLAQDTHLPPIKENRRSVKGRRNKTVAQPIKTIGYMKEVPPSSSNKPAWIEIAQRKTQRVSEALHSTDRLPQLPITPTKHTTNTKNTSPENDMSKESGLPVDGYVRRRLRTFSQDQET